MPDRVIDDHIFYAVYDGSIRAWLDGKEQHWMDGSFTWVGPGVRQHAVNLNPGKRLEFFVFRVGIIDESGEKAKDPFPPFTCNQARELFPYLEALVQPARMESPLAQERAKGILCALFAQALELQSFTRQTQGLTPYHRSRITAWMNQNLDQNPSAADLANCTGLSLHYFRQQFKRSFGCSPREWIRRERLRHAAALLRESDEPVQEVAEICGYSSLPSFSRLFSHQYGCSPAQWRQRLR